MLKFKSFISEAKNPKSRVRLIKARIRTVNGKPTVQRRKRVSGVKGYTVKGGTLKRMSSLERLHRKRGQRIGKLRRKAKMARIVLKRQRSIRRRKSIGL